MHTDGRRWKGLGLVRTGMESMPLLSYESRPSIKCKVQSSYGVFGVQFSGNSWLGVSNYFVILVKMHDGLWDTFQQTMHSEGAHVASGLVELEIISDRVSVVQSKGSLMSKVGRFSS